jgi:hypothetical protein
LEFGDFVPTVIDEPADAGLAKQKKKVSTVTKEKTKIRQKSHPGQG